MTTPGSSFDRGSVSPRCQHVATLPPRVLPGLCRKPDALVPASPPDSGSHAEMVDAHALLIKAHRIGTTLLPEATYPETLARRALSRENHRAYRFVTLCRLPVLGPDPDRPHASTWKSPGKSAPRPNYRRKVKQELTTPTPYTNGSALLSLVAAGSKRSRCIGCDREAMTQQNLGPPI